MTEEFKTNLSVGKDHGISLESWVEQHLKIAENHAQLNAFVHIFREQALAEAQRIDREIAAGRNKGLLYGILISVKDNICIADRPVSAASAILRGYVSPFSATAVERLLSEDAIIIGTTNCDEFGMGSGSTHSTYGPVRNAADPQKVAGGSSGGAAVSVQIGACHLALGTDTGGSIRQPAAFCDLLGFKPGYGKISRHGLIAYASSFDQLGFIAKDPAYIELAYQLCKGADEYDATVSRTPDETAWDLSSVRLAGFSNFFAEGNAYTADVLAVIRQLSETWPVDFTIFEGMDYLVPTYYILTTAEASTNLSRYDGVRYGYRHPEAKSLDEMYKWTRTSGFGAEVKKRIMLGTFVLSEGYFDAYYTKAQKVRQKLRNNLMAILQKSDFIVIPVTASGPWAVDYVAKDALEVYYSDVYTVLASLGGLPAISVPLTFANRRVNLQILAAPNHERKLLAFSKKLIEIGSK
jgi:aspartyl-tRNA(Asn)/glutamyl-tRNA(Gln) amidotransferase subunit A